MAELCFSRTCVSKLLLKLRVSSRSLISFLLFLEVYRLRVFVCQYVQARPWFRPSTWASSVAGIGFVSCSLYKLMYFARMTRHSVWHRLSVVYLYPLCGSKILYSYWLSKRSQLSNVVFDPFPFEACVCSSLFCVFEI